MSEIWNWRTGAEVFTSNARTFLGATESSTNGRPTKDVAQDLAKYLEDEFQMEMGLAATDLWSGNILQQLARSEVFICVLTETNAKKMNYGPDKDWCWREFKDAAKHRASMIFLIVASKKFARSKQMEWLV